MGRRKQQGRPRGRKIGKNLLVVVEGSKNMSEADYLQRLSQHLRGRISLHVEVEPGEGEPSKVFKKAIDKMSTKDKEYDYVCLLMDVDEHATLDQVLKNCEKNLPPIDAVVTCPKFELWLLWHVKDQTGHIKAKDLDRRVQEHGLVRGERGKALSNSFPIENYKAAVGRAERAARCHNQSIDTRKKLPNPSSTIPWLIHLIEGAK